MLLGRNHSQAPGAHLMHEFSIISSIIDLVKQEMETRPVILVKEVKLEIGELTFLAEDALQFGFTALVEKEEKIANDALKIISIPAEVKCFNCEYTGPMRIKDSEKEALHITPVFQCPKCQGKIEIIKGKECTVVNLRMELED
jgi:hydrogenase nickel insertion protein HypA